MASGHAPVRAGSEERRATPRIQISTRVSFSGREIQGGGQLRNLSLSGALIGDARPMPPCWSRLRITFSTAWSVRLSIDAAVVRHQDDGFAVMFTSLNPVAERMLRALVRSGDVQ